MTRQGSRARMAATMRGSHRTHIIGGRFQALLGLIHGLRKGGMNLAVLLVPVGLTLAFNVVCIALSGAVPSSAYLLIGVTYLAMGAFDLRTASPLNLMALLAGQSALVLVGDVVWHEALVNAAVLSLAASAIPLLVRSKVLQAAVNQRRLMTRQIEARLLVGEGLAKGCTPNPHAVALDPGASSESVARNMLLMAKKAMRARTAAFCWYDSGSSCLVPIEVLSDIPEQLANVPINISQGRLAGLKTSQGRLTFRLDPREPHYAPFYRRKVQISGLMAVPVRSRNELAGAFLFDKEGADPFFLPDDVMVKNLAAVVEENLANERRLKSAVLMSTMLKNLNDFSKELAANQTYDQVYESILRHGIDFAPFGHAILAHRTSPESQEYELVGVSSKELSSLMGKRFSLEGSLCGLAARSRTILPSNLVFEHRMPQPFGVSVPLEVEVGDATLLLPLMDRNEAVGFLLYVEAVRPVDRDELAPVTLLGEFAAQALKSAEANHALERMATSDPLTGIPNQRAFRTRLDEAFQRSQRSRKPLSILFVDVDHFKSVNDTYGHAVGDIALQKVASALCDSVRKVDFVARWGGEEFVVILEEADRQGAMILAERVRQRVGKTDIPELSNQRVVTVSVGLATWPDDSSDANELLALADAALYKAKNAGRDCCQSA